MYACPACHARTISYFRKWCSGPTAPAFCSACGRYSHAKYTSGGVGLVAATILITAGGFSAVALQAYWPLLCGVAVALAFYFWHWHRVGLQTLSEEQVARARKTEAMSTLALLLTIFLQ